MSKHSKNYRQNELKIRRIETTSDRLTGRAGLSLFVAYMHGIHIFSWFDRWFGSIRKNRKGLPITELFKQVLCFFVDGTSRRLTYFDQLSQDEGYAGSIETDRAHMASSHQVKRFFQAFAWTRVFLFRRLLHTLFVWRLKINRPDVIELGIDTMVTRTTSSATGVSSALNLREDPSITARIVASYTPGTILENLGCQSGEGRIWCDVQQFGGGPRSYVAEEFLKPAVSPDASVAMGPDDSALRAGQGKFDATGNIPCVQYIGQPMTECEFGGARAGGGYATVLIKKPDGHTRAIFFRMGKPIGADTSQADGYLEFRATKENELHLILIGNERYEIPDAVILGG